MSQKLKGQAIVKTSLYKDDSSDPSIRIHVVQAMSSRLRTLVRARLDGSHAGPSSHCPLVLY